MAIRVTTRSTASQQQAPLEAFGYNKKVFLHLRSLQVFDYCNNEAVD